MSLQQAVRRIRVDVVSSCTQCRRNVTISSRPKQQNQSATSMLTDLMQSKPGNTERSSRAAPSASSSAPARFRDAPSDAHRVAQSSLRESIAARKQQQLEEMQRRADREDYEKQMTRRWRNGEVYSPHDLSGEEMAKWKRAQRGPIPKKISGGGDVMDRLGLNPMHLYKNFSVMSDYMTETGRIRHSKDTGLRPVNQRRMARAIRRAVGIGLIPAVYRHPQLLLTQRGRRSGS